MKALSLWQPWASFIAIGAKPFETRAWSPPLWLIGIAIHAAKKAVDADNRAWAREHGIEELPMGAVVCTAILAGAYRVGPSRVGTGLRIIAALPGSREMAVISADEFGDYSDGRWAWLLADVARLRQPVPARGAQGFWDWSERPA